MRERQSFHTGIAKTKLIKLTPLILALVICLCSCSPGISPSKSVSEPTTVSSSPDAAVQDTSPTPHIDTPVLIEPSEPAVPSESAEPSETSQAAYPLDEALQVSILDVGQADCILVKTGQHAMLIDAGDVGQGSLILDYLLENGVTELDYLVATHPHADHIGSMPDVIRAMDGVGLLLMPDVVHTTKTYESLLDAIEETDIEVTIPQPGDIYEMGSARIQILAPFSTKYDDLNNYSIVLRIVYGSISFLLTGDAEKLSETEQLRDGFDLRADVLKVGHHGSDSSSSTRYLDAVMPTYAVISCGNGNSYGHPHNDTVSRLIERGVTLYRTDENGTIAFTTDGFTVSANIELEANVESDSLPTIDNAVPDSAESSISQYIGNKNSKKFHKPSCSTLPAEKNRVYFSSRADAIKSKYQPCQRCKP